MKMKDESKWMVEIYAGIQEQEGMERYFFQEQWKCILHGNTPTKW